MFSPGTMECSLARVQDETQDAADSNTKEVAGSHRVRCARPGASPQARLDSGSTRRGGGTQLRAGLPYRARSERAEADDDLAARAGVRDDGQRTPEAAPVSVRTPVSRIHN